MKNNDLIKSTRFVNIDNNFLRIFFYCTIFLALTFFSIIIGVLIGYAVIGDGNPLDIFNWNTWQHILDFLK